MTASPTQRFRPITVEKPKVLLPLVNAPLLEYTLEWLALNGMEEVGLPDAAAAAPPPPPLRAK